MTKEISVLSYTRTGNIGDEIQSLASINVLNKLGIKHGGFVDRDNLKAPKNTNLLVNGYIPDNSLETKAQGIHLIFSNLHIANYRKEGLNKRIEDLRKYQPIGCRDRYTMDLLHQAGVEAFYNQCLTLTFDKRKKEPLNGKVFVVDLYPKPVPPLPKIIRKQQIHYIKHTYYAPTIAERMKKAQTLLDTYRDEAKLVITGRLHCALPCIAMGIPVILLGDHAPHRLSIAWDFIPRYNIPVIRTKKSHNAIQKFRYSLRYKKEYVLNRLFYYRKIDWEPQPLDIEPIKKQIIAQVGEQIKRFT